MKFLTLPTPSTYSLSREQSVYQQINAQRAGRTLCYLYCAYWRNEVCEALVNSTRLEGPLEFLVKIECFKLVGMNYKLYAPSVVMKERIKSRIASEGRCRGCNASNQPRR
jgi:hypothetical protein